MNRYENIKERFNKDQVIDEEDIKYLFVIIDIEKSKKYVDTNIFKNKICNMALHTGDLDILKILLELYEKLIDIEKKAGE